MEWASPGSSIYRFYLKSLPHSRLSSLYLNVKPSKVDFQKSANFLFGSLGDRFFKIGKIEGSAGAKF